MRLIKNFQMARIFHSSMKSHSVVQIENDGEMENLMAMKL